MVFTDRSRSVSRCSELTHSPSTSPKWQKTSDGTSPDEENTNTVPSILSILNEMKEDLKKTNKQVNASESCFERSHMPSVQNADNMLSVMAFLDKELD